MFFKLSFVNSNIKRHAFACYNHQMRAKKNVTDSEVNMYSFVIDFPYWDIESSPINQTKYIEDKL